VTYKGQDGDPDALNTATLGRKFAKVVVNATQLSATGIKFDDWQRNHEFMIIAPVGLSLSRQIMLITDYDIFVVT